MSIKPVGSQIYLNMQTVEKVGDLDTSFKKTVREWGEVMAVGPEVSSVKVGDTILFKAWGLDSITYEKKEYFFINEKSNAICAVLK